MYYRDILFLEVEDVHSAHEAAIDIGGGDRGVLNLGMVESATMAPRCGYYATLAAIAAAYVLGIAKNHGYRDGNKRTATICLGKFLGANGFDVVLGPEWADIVVSVSTGVMSREELAMVIARLMGGDPVMIE